MRILYLGQPIGVLFLQKHGYCPEWVCLGLQGEPGENRVKSWIKPENLCVGSRALSNTAWHKDPDFKPDLLLSFYFPRLITDPWLGCAPHAIGFHPSLLPKHRGPDPYFHTLKNGDTETGVTLFHLSAHYDAGDIIKQVRAPVHEDDHVVSLARRLDRISIDMMLDVVKEIERGHSLPSTPQDETLASTAPEPKDEDLVINFSDTTQSILNLIRAASPYPLSTMQLGDHLVGVIKATNSLLTLPSGLPAALLPGEAYVHKGHVHIKTGDGGIQLLHVQKFEQHQNLCGESISQYL